MSPIRSSSLGGIPFGNTASRPASPATGQPYFNGEIGRLEVYTSSTGWQNIVQETPGVVSYTGTVLETNSTNTLVISGTNFTTGATASLIGNDGTEYIANTTTVNSIVQLTAVFGVLPASKEPYDIKVVNPSNLYGILSDAVSVNDTPSWTTAAGSLGTFNENSSVSVTVAATDEENNAITYSISSGSLPSGLTLNSSTGVISGTAASLDSTTTYSFTISASDGLNTSTLRSFSITIQDVMPGLTSSNPARSGTEIYDWMVANGQSSFTNGNYWIKPQAYTGSPIECFVWLENNSFGRGAVLCGALDSESGFSMASQANGRNITSLKNYHTSLPGTGNAALLPQSFINALVKDSTTNHIIGGITSHASGNGYGTFWQIRPLSAPAKGTTSSLDMWRYIFATGEANNNVQMRVNTDAQSNVGWSSYSFHNTRNISWGSWFTFTGGRNSSDDGSSHHYMPDDQTGGGEWMFRENMDDIAARAYGGYALSNFYIV